MGIFSSVQYPDSRQGVAGRERCRAPYVFHLSVQIWRRKEAYGLGQNVSLRLADGQPASENFDLASASLLSCCVVEAQHVSIYIYISVCFCFSERGVLSDLGSFLGAGILVPCT